MLKGDLSTSRVPEVLRQLADGSASGCLHVMDGPGEAAKVYLKRGQVYAVQLPNRFTQLGARLVSSGALAPEALAEAMEAQRTELQGWRLGELLVHLGYVDQEVVEAYIHEQVREQLTELIAWDRGTWKFRVNERTREDVAPPTSVEDLLGEAAEREAEWDRISETVHGPDAIPLLSSAGQSDAEMSIDPEAWSLLCKVDGSRSIADLAVECGFTLYEAGHVVHTLVQSGLLEVEPPVEQPAPTGSIASRLAAAFAPALTTPARDHTPAEVATLLTAALSQDRGVEALKALEEQEVTQSLGRASTALAAVLGTTTDESLFAAPKPRKPRSPQEPPPLTPAEQAAAAKKAERLEREARRRAGDAAELAAAQAELEAHKADELAKQSGFAADHEAEIVNLGEVRREAARRDEAEEVRLAEQAAAAEAAAAEAAAEAAAAEAAAAEAAAEAARVAEQERLAEEAAAAEAAEAARIAEEERLAQEAAAAEEAAAEAARIAEEERLAEEAAAAEAAAAEAVRVAEEERLAHEAAAAEAAATEAARIAEEERIAEEAAAAAEAARIAEEARAAEEARLAEEAWLAEESKLQELARLEEAELSAKQARLAEEARQAEERAAIEAAQEARVEQELRLAAEQQAAARAEAEALASHEQVDDQHDDDEQIRQNAHRSGASTAFAELSESARTAVEAPAPLLEEEDDEDDDEDDEPAPYQGRDADTDMASLLRELSSLGMEDAPAPAPSPARPPGPPRTMPQAPAKKKKGLFGR